jgi:hypothetical protein
MFILSWRNVASCVGKKRPVGNVMENDDPEALLNRKLSGGLDGALSK